MKKSIFSLSVSLLARWVLGGVFAYAGLMKLLEPAANFQAALEQYPLLPPVILPFLARFLPWVEWILGMLLVLGYAIRGCTLVLGLLSISFVVVLTASFSSGGALKHCGCFGNSGIPLSGREVYLLDWLNIVLAVFIFWRHDISWSVDSLLRKRAESRD